MKTNHSSIKIRVREMPPVIKKLIADKAIIQAYAKGEVSKQELRKRGIHLVNPL
jgi:hypothetical protein